MKMSRIQFQAGMSLNQFFANYGANSNANTAAFKSRGVRLVGFCHCSGELAGQIFEEEYREYFINAGVRKKINGEEV
ncbi:MAG: hypothetical protein QNK24_08340 [Desulfuromusa sp.]|nr:hypothetical protein [Desulfuromusa sp.]